MTTPGRVLRIVLLATAASAAGAQQSASYRIREATLNAGGHPSNQGIPTSTSWQVTLDAIGDGTTPAELASGSFGLSATFIAGFAPPGEVEGLDFVSPVILAWSAERSAGTYNLYRGLLSEIASLGYGGCKAWLLTTTAATDGEVAPASNGFFYLVTVRNRVGEEGTKGFRSDGIERGGTVCP